jgi:hypothetical protein
MIHPIHTIDLCAILASSGAVLARFAEQRLSILQIAQ